MLAPLFKPVMTGAAITLPRVRNVLAVCDCRCKVLQLNTLLGPSKFGSRRMSTGSQNRMTEGPTRLAYTIRRPTDEVGQSRTPLLLVGGWCMTRADWGTELVNSLGARRPIITFDSRGVGESDCPEGPYTVEMLANDCANILRDAGAKYAAILGVSMGGMIAQLLAKNNPSLVHTLILGCTTHGGREALPPPKDFFQIFATWDGAGKEQKTEMAGKFLEHMLGKAWWSQHDGAREQLLRNFMAANRPAAGINAQLSALGRFNSLDYVGSLTAPTLVVHGEQDAVVPFGNAQLLAAKLPNAQLLALPNCGHMWWVSSAEKAAAAINEYLDKLD